MHPLPQPDRNRGDSRPMPTRCRVTPTLRDMMGKRHSQTTLALPAVRPPAPANDKVTDMIHPSDSEITRPVAVRDGQGAPVTCAACGCRLTQTGEAWFHFNPIGGRDARGCRIVCADAAHDTTGRPVSLAV